MKVRNRRNVLNYFSIQAASVKFFRDISHFLITKKTSLNFVDAARTFQ